MRFNFGVDFAEFHNLEGLRKLDQIFLDFLYNNDQDLYREILSLRLHYNQVDDKYYSDFLLKISPFFDDFLAKLFDLEPEIMKLRLQHERFNIIYECKRKFVQRIAIKKYPKEKIADIDFAYVSKYLEKIFVSKITQENFAKQIINWQLDVEKYVFELDIASQFAAFMVFNGSDDILFNIPQKVDHNNLIDLNKIEKHYVRTGFDYNPIFNLDRPLNEVHYCIYCHNKGKDSCSKGLILQDSLNLNSKFGCPLKQKISEMNYVKSKGFVLASLAIIIIDNPMVAATGHRICNDCSKACIYQKQDPVDIPLIESNILDIILQLPYGVEIYLLLTRWNPLNIFTYLPNNQTNYNILVAGLGPAGFSLSYYLLREGHNVVAIDGLKITPLSFDINKPIKYWSDYQQQLSQKIPQGFGGVMEYGITSRWNKNKLMILRLLLERHSNFKFFSSVRLGSNLTLDQAFDIGFDHVAYCTGAGSPKMVKIDNFLAKGVRTASDFLMTLQSGGAFLKDSITNLVIRMPIAIIGGGLTSIDSAVESMHYYKLQVEKFLSNYELLCEKHTKDYIEENWTIEDKLIAQEFIEHAKLFRQVQDIKSVKKIFNDLGGVTIYYRDKLNVSPAYKLNHEELIYSMAEGVRFVENMVPLQFGVDNYNYFESIEFDHLGIKQKVPARTILIAIGIEHNNLQMKFRNNVSYFGDCNPLFSGSVVKAIASSREGYKSITNRIIKNPPNFSDNYSKLFLKLDYLLTSSIKNINILSDKLVELIVHSPLAAQNFKPGQFFRLQNYSNNPATIIEPLALTGSHVNKKEGLIHFIVFEIGKSTNLCRNMLNEHIALMGPVGYPTEILKDSNIVLVGGGFCTMVLLPISKALKEQNCNIIYFAGYKKIQDRFYQEKIEELADVIVWCCEEDILSKNREQDISIKGDIVDGIKYISLKSDLTVMDRIIVIGSTSLMESIKVIKNDFFSKKTKLIVNVNSPMQCMMQGICGQCIQQLSRGGEYIFTCICQGQDAEIIDFLGLKNRLEQNSLQEKL